MGAGADAHIKLDTVATQLSQSSFADRAKDEFIRKFTRNWMNMNYLTIILFHSSSVDVLNNEVTAVDSKVLKPVQAGLVADCCPVDVRFFFLQLTLNYTNMVARLGSSTLNVMYYLDLFQKNGNIAN